MGVMLPPSLASCHLWAAASWIRALEVPINPDFRGDVLVHILNDTACALLVTRTHLLPQLMAVQERLPHLKTVIVLDGQGTSDLDCRFIIFGAEVFAESGKSVACPPQLNAGDASTILYTSGTTGRSKGCVIPWGLWRWGAGLYAYAEDGSDCHYSPYPMNHLSGKMALYNMARFCGRAVIKERFSLSDFWKDIRQYQCTNTLLMGSTASMLLKEPERSDDRDNPLRNVGMAPIPPTFREFERRFGVKLTTGYGSTETAWPILSGGRDLTDHQTCGRVRSEFEVRIVNDEGSDVDVGQVGEIIVRCKIPDSTLIEYWGNPDATEKAWADGWFHTGDAFRADIAGNYYFVDRKKDVIRRRAENISSFEVEHYIKLHPAVMECAAVGVPDEQSEEEILVVLTTREGYELQPRELIDWLRPLMPAFMIPRYIRVTSSLPLTPTNKVRKGELKSKGLTSDTWDRKTA